MVFPPSIPRMGVSSSISGDSICGFGYRRKAGQFKPVDPSLSARKPIKIEHPTRSLFCGVSRLKPVAVVFIGIAFRNHRKPALKMLNH